MISKQAVAYTIIGIISVALLIHTWLLGDGELPVWVWLPVLGLLAWALWQLRERPERNAKTFDFNPKRGFFFFVAGLFVFPIAAGIEALFGANLTLSGMLVFTLFASLLAAVIGTFTERVPL